MVNESGQNAKGQGEHGESGEVNSLPSTTYSWIVLRLMFVKRRALAMRAGDAWVERDIAKRRDLLLRRFTAA